MNPDTFEYRDEGKNRISGLRIATLGEVEVHILDIHVHFNGQAFEVASVHILCMFAHDRCLVHFGKHFSQALDIFLAGSE